MNEASKILLQLLRLELMGKGEISFPNGFCNWDELVAIAFDHMVEDVSADGMQRWCDMHYDVRFSIDDACFDDTRYKWYGAAFQAEKSYKKHSSVVKSLCSFFREHGLLPVLLKGYGLSFDYPIPSHRSMGDIDLYLMQNGGVAAAVGDELVSKELGIKVEDSNENTRHSHFTYKGIPVENHYMLGDGQIHATRELLLEKRLKDLIARNLKSVDDCELTVPGVDFNAVFLIWHMTSHFTYDAVNLRQLCDWLMFLKAHHGEINWPLVTGIWRESGMDRFAGVVSDFLIKYLGMDAAWVPEIMVDEKLSARFACEVMGEKKRSWKRLDNALFYPRNAWKFRLTGEGCWVKHIMRRVRSHIFG